MIDYECILIYGKWCATSSILENQWKIMSANRPISLALISHNIITSHGWFHVDIESTYKSDTILYLHASDIMMVCIADDRTSSHSPTGKLPEEDTPSTTQLPSGTTSERMRPGPYTSHLSMTSTHFPDHIIRITITCLTKVIKSTKNFWQNPVEQLF